MIIASHFVTFTPRNDTELLSKPPLCLKVFLNFWKALNVYSNGFCDRRIQHKRLCITPTFTQQTLPPV